MAETVDCDICCDSVFILVECPCTFKACETCCRKYLLQCLDKPHCMKCKVEWTPRFLYQHFSKSWLDGNKKGEYRHYIKKVLVDREVAQIPETLIQMTTTPNLTTEQKPQTTFICPCPSSTCRGMIKTTDKKCCICEASICSACRELLKTDQKHSCNKDTVETIRLLKQDTKACPKCAVLIHRIQGCDQMYCTECHVLFSWNNGTIDNGIIHNPHAIEWRRKNGTLERNHRDIPCGGYVDLNRLENLLSSVFRQCGGKDSVRYKFLDLYYGINRVIGECEQHIRFINNKDLTALRRQYLRNKISREKWSKSIFMTERENARRTVKRQIFQTFRDLGVEQTRHLYESLYELYEHFEKVTNKFDLAKTNSEKQVKEILITFLNTMEQMRVFINETLDKELTVLGATHIPRINETWIWRNIFSW